MSSEEVFEKVKGIIVEQLGVADTAVTLEASFIDDLGADSLDIVELVMALEEEFDIEIPDADAEKVVTVGDVVDYIKEKLDRIVENNFKDIEILRDDLGKPVVKTYNNLKQICIDYSVLEIKVSISHTKDYAAANAITITA